MYRASLNPTPYTLNPESLWYFTVTLDPYLFGFIGFLSKAAKILIFSYPPKGSQGMVKVSQKARGARCDYVNVSRWPPAFPTHGHRKVMMFLGCLFLMVVQHA